VEKKRRKLWKNTDKVKEEVDTEGKSELDDWCEVFPSVSFIGVQCFIGIGVLKEILTFASDFINAHRVDYNLIAHEETFSRYVYYKEQVLAGIGVMLSGVTILCIINMITICNLPMIKKGLKNASLKFIATRLLVLASQFQAQFLIGTTGSPPTIVAKYLGLSQYQAMLLQSVLLTYECVLLVIFNFVAWYLQVELDNLLGFDQEEVNETLGVDNNKAPATATAPLLTTAPARVQPKTSGFTFTSAPARVQPKTSGFTGSGAKGNAMPNAASARRGWS
jgi:hypothetical protein